MVEKEMKKIGVTANIRKPHTPAVLERLAAAAGEMGAELVCCDDTAQSLPSIRKISRHRMVAEIELFMALGGDGTVLRAISILNGCDVPILGVNLGSLGFMTTVTEDKLEHALRCVQEGKCGISERTLAVCSLSGSKKEYIALNDVAIGWGRSSRVVTLNVRADGEEVSSYVCDGIVVSTPTGSTGHSLSSGGPIIHPEVRAFVLSPICPHTLSNRPLVIPDTCVIEVEVQAASKTLLLTMDGQEQLEVNRGDVIRIARSPHRAKLIRLPDYNYYSLLRHKLHWRGSTV